MLKTFICKRCKKEFEKQHYPSRKSPVYCSPECRKNRIVESCIICGKSFIIHKCRKCVKRYCSRECGFEGRRRPKQLCRFCKKEHRPLKTGNQFCSLRCAMNSRKATRLNKSCELCGEAFIVKKGYTHARFCSIKCSAQFLAKPGPENPNWRGGSLKYRGSNWDTQSNKARKRDNNTCQHCGFRQIFPRLPVHHIKPCREFDGDYEAANRLDNLITLCSACHSRANNTKRPRDIEGKFLIPLAEGESQG